MNQTGERPGINRATLTIVVTILVLLVAAGARSAPGVFLKPIQGDTGFQGFRKVGSILNSV